MAKKKERIEEQMIAVESALSRSERFIEENYKLLLGIFAGILVVVVGIFGYAKYIKEPREIEAQSQIFMAQRYFEMDSLNLALNGDGMFLGFLAIADDYSSTKAGKLANYYAGISYLKMGDFDSAIEYLDKFSSKDEIVSCMAIGAKADAYLEKGDNAKAIKLYKEAAKKKDNEFTSPMFMFKAGLVLEMENQWAEALDLYKTIKTDYFRSYEAQEIDKYIARAEANL
ncbi:MAG: tetratricopeptide repeat protein [Bacteroidales bacterium]|jgi:tetratricopeptide (TPR) repeat protein|nr:tetratricopeptide repeat protein [Bacteroidales bacterium]